MRVHGTLTKWNDERGFGFITPAKASGDVFVHISAFPRDGVRPRVNELISFEVEPGPNGKQRAVRVMRPGQKRAVPPVRSAGDGRSHVGGGGYVLALLAAAALGFYGYKQYQQRLAAAPEPEPQIDFPVGIEAPPRESYACDGRTMCSQMTSCPEATYFIRNCPNTQMDGDHDGVPCESQWCD